MRAGRWFLDELNIPLTAESTTREALIKSIEDSLRIVQFDTKGDSMKHCSVSCFSEELVVFMGTNKLKNADLIAALCDWFDCRDKWEYDTKHQGRNTIYGVFFNLLGGTTPDMLASSMFLEAIGGGLPSRMIFVVAWDKEKYVAFPQYNKDELALREMLKSDLEQIHNIAGEYTFTPEALDLYENWYLNISIKEGIDDPRFYGYTERRATHMKKLSIICSASSTNDTVISTADLKRALSLMYKVEAPMPQAFGYLGRWEFAPLMIEIHEEIIKRGSMTEGEVIAKFVKEADFRSLQAILLQLRRGGMIDVSGEKLDVFKAVVRDKGKRL